MHVYMTHPRLVTVLSMRQAVDTNDCVLVVGIRTSHESRQVRIEVMRQM
jgi:hypothetical protein